MTKQMDEATTGVVAVVRAWSGTGAFPFTSPRTLSHTQAIRYTSAVNDGAGLIPVLGTRAWSPPV